MHLPDDDDPENDDGYDDPSDELDGAEADDQQALIWNLLLLINPGDEETALRQFAAYRDALTEDEAEEPVWILKDAIDWTSGFYVDWKDTEALIDSLNQLAARWNIVIDWGGDPSDDDFMDDVDVPMLMARAYDRLREHGYTLWTWNTEGDAYAGWIALSRDDEGMQQLATILGMEIRPGSDAF